MNEVEEKIIKIIDEEINKCGDKIYPSICSIKDQPEGRNKIIQMVLNLIRVSGMSVQSAIAQIESSL
jgi:hypothetical protein